MAAEIQLLEAAMQLRSHAPVAWEDFLAHLDALAARAADECVGSPASEIYVAQGRARALRQLAKDLHNAPTVHARLRDKAKQTRG